MRRPMRSPKTRNKASSLLVASLFGLALVTSVSHAVEKAAPEAATVSCALLERFEGNVELLNPSRSFLLPAVTGAGVPCDGWVSVGQGWAQLRHRDGFKVKLSAGSFVQFSESLDQPKAKAGAKSGAKSTEEDQIVLYHGEIYADNPGGRELRILTANARARVLRGKSVVVFSKQYEETQVIACEGKAKFENRFETARHVQLKEGEASSLSLQSLRVVPSAPKAVALASLRQKLAAFKLGEKDVHSILVRARTRAERKFATNLAPNGAPQSAGHEPQAAEGEAGARKASRGLASATDTHRGPAVEHRRPAVEEDGKKQVSAEASRPGKAKGHYTRHVPRPEDEALKKHWVRKIVSGQEAGEKILFPEKRYGKSNAVKIEVEDLRKNDNDKEKARLLEQLANIRSE